MLIKIVEVERIRRITGYLVGDINKWNNAKKSELQDRKTHTHKSYMSQIEYINELEELSDMLQTVEEKANDILKNIKYNKKEKYEILDSIKTNKDTLKYYNILAYTTSFYNADIFNYSCYVTELEQLQANIEKLKSLVNKCKAQEIEERKKYEKNARVQSEFFNI